MILRRNRTESVLIDAFPAEYTFHSKIVWVNFSTGPRAVCSTLEPLRVHSLLVGTFRAAIDRFTLGGLGDPAPRYIGPFSPEGSAVDGGFLVLRTEENGYHRDQSTEIVTSNTKREDAVQHNVLFI